MAKSKKAPNASSRLTASIVPVQRIGQDVLELKDGRFVCIVECQGILFRLLRPDQQDLVLSAYLSQFITSLDGAVQIVVQPDTVDLREDIADWQARIESGLLPPQIAEEFSYALQLHQGRMERTAYLFVVSADSRDEAIRRSDHLIGALSAVAEDLHPERCSTDRAIALLARGFGRTLPAPGSYYLSRPAVAGTAALESETAAAPEPATKRRRRRRDMESVPSAVSEDAVFSLEADATDWPEGPRLADLIQPAMWHDRQQEVQVAPDLYARTLTAQLYPAEASTGFLERLLSVPVPRRMSWHIRPLDSAGAVQALQRRIQAHEGSLVSAQREGRQPDPYRMQRYQEAVRLRDQLAANVIKLFSLQFLVTIFGKDLAELNTNCRKFLDAAKAGMWEFLPVTFEQQAGFLSTLPIASPQVGQAREIDSGSLACMFPATHFEIVERGGLYLGMNLSTDGAVLVDLLNEQRWPASHVVFLSATGGGKSWTVKNTLTQVLGLAEWDVAVIDPSPPVDYARWTQAMGGRYLRFGPGSPDRWNVCAIAYPNNARELRPEERRFVSDKIDFLATLFGMIYSPGGKLDPELRAKVEEHTQAAYRDKGIIDGELGSLVRPDTLGLHPVMKAMPRLSDLRDRFMAAGDPELRKLAIALGPYCEGGSLDLFDAPHNPDLEDIRCVVYNVENITRRAPQLFSLTYLMVGELIAQQMAGSRRRMVIAIDEAHYLFAHEDSARWVSRLYRTARKSHGAVWLITQGITDMIGDGVHESPGAADARACFGNSYIAWLGKQEKDVDLQLMKQQWRLSDSEVDFLRRAEPGQGLWVAPSRFHLVAQADAPPTLQRLIGTRSNEVTEQGLYDDPLNGVRPRVAAGS